MRLNEEFLSRHGIGVRLVQHVTSGSLIVRTDSTGWLVVTIRLTDNGIHPAMYNIDFYRPVHNGYATGRIMSKIDTKELEWDEYEDFLLNWAWQPRMVPACVNDEFSLVLAAWEIFVYVYDGWLAAQPPELRGYVDVSLDTSLPLTARYTGYQNCLIYLTARHPGVLKSWKHEILALVQHYSDWLSRLFPESAH